MNVLFYRDLQGPTVDELRKEFGVCEFRATTDPGRFAEWRDWPEVVFGNAPASLVAASRSIRWLQIVSSGFDEYRTLQGGSALVTTARGVHAGVIARHVLLMFLHFVRGQHHFADCQRRKVWDRRPSVPQDPAALTVGFVAYGAVGSEAARLMRPLRTRLIAAKQSPAATPPELDELLSWDRFGDLLAASDHVVLTLPLTGSTRGILDAAWLDRMKRGAVLHNIARGALVDEPALIERLGDGRIGGAALDVFAQEPLPASSPLWEMPNVVVTPHLAGHHRDLGRILLERFKENLRRYVQGEPLLHAADFARGY